MQEHITTNKWTIEQAVSFARSSAYMAFDQQHEYASLQDAVDEYRDNVRDTLAEQCSTCWEPDAFAAFDRLIVSLKYDKPLKA